MGALIIWACSGGDSPTEPKIELPTVQNIEFALEEDTSKTFAFMGADPLNRALTYSVSTQPQHGTLTINAGAGTYTPNANYHGADTFAYIATNVDGSSNIGTIVATITPVDDEPNSMDVSATTDEDNAIDITLQAEEVDGDNIEFQVRNNPSNGSVSISGTTATYTPNENWNGTDTFNFEAVDSNARSVLNVATATITVNPVNDAPVVENIDDIEATINQPISITLVGSDVDNDNLTFTVENNPTNGTVSFNGNEATYTGQSLGSDSFTFKANDGTTDSNIGTVIIDVTSSKFQVTFGGSAHDSARSVQQVNDGGYILGGVTRSFGNKQEMYLIKADINGSEEWSKTFGGVENDLAMTVRNTSDGGFILGGRNEPCRNCPDNMYLIKTDSQGNEEWSKSFGGNEDDYIHSVNTTNDGGYILGGYTNSFDNGNYDMFLVKIDNLGNQEWSKTFGGSAIDVGEEVVQTTDDGYVFVGWSDSFGSDRYFYIVKTDSNGNEEWSKSFPNSGYGTAYSVKQTSDNGFIIAGLSNGNALIIKTNSSGQEEWSKILGGHYPYSLEITNDNGFIIGGFTLPEGSSSYDMLLIKTDSNGNEEWSKTFGGGSNEMAYSVSQADDGGYILAGYTESYGEGSQDVYFIKTDSEGNRIF
jgi:hypothetical protein